MKIVSVSGGSTHSLVATQHLAALAFGGGELGQLGINLDPQASGEKSQNEACWDLADKSSPKLIRQLKANNINVSQVACGDSHSLILSTTGQVYSFGDGTFGALGIRGYIDKTVAYPSLVMPLALIPVHHVAAGNATSVAVTATGSIYS